MRNRIGPVIVILLSVLAGATAPARAANTGAPTITAFTWHERTGTADDPILNFSVTFDAPAGLSSGEVRLASVWHEVLGSVSLGPAGPGSSTVDLQLAPPGDEARPWDLIGLTLTGSDGQTTDYGFCDLTRLVETRERASVPRLDTTCLGPGGGWVIYTFQVTSSEATATLWGQGVAVRNNTAVGTGDVLEDPSGTIVRWGTATSLAYPQAQDGAVVKAGDTTIIDQPPSDPSAGAGPHRIVVGIGGVLPTTLVPGVTYRWAKYYAIRPGHFDLPFISLEGTDIDLLGVETGDSVGIAWGQDFRPSVVAKNSTADLGAVALGEVDRSFSQSVTCMFVAMNGFIGPRPSPIGLTRIEGPSAPQTGGVIKAGQPGDYRFEAEAAVGQSWNTFVVGYADMPLTPH